VIIPKSEAELDSAWASSVLGRDVTVTGIEGVGVGAAFACDLYRLFLDAPPTTMVVKLPVTGDARPLLDGIGAYSREILFYRDVAPHLPVRTPKVYAAVQDSESTDFVLAMEDLNDCWGVDQIEGFTVSQAEAVVDGLASFHGWSWGEPELLARYEQSFLPVTSPAGQTLQSQYVALFAHVWGARREALSAQLTPAVMALGDHYGELQPEFLEDLAEPRAITHGELRADNLFFDKNGKPVFFDFQTAQQECGIRELAYLLCTSVPQAVLERHEQELIERYWDGLRVNDFPLSRAREQYRQAVKYNLLWPVMASMRYESSSDRGRATLDDMITKLGAAITRNG
jgi:Ecdysteroid kinase-like family